MGAEQGAKGAAGKKRTFNKSDGGRAGDRAGGRGGGKDKPRDNNNKGNNFKKRDFKADRKQGGAPSSSSGMQIVKAE